jgi:uroporphyrin-III C-methyltransferase
MGVARLPAVLDVLRSTEMSILKRAGSAYPSHVPIAIIERASMLDQRVIYSTLRDAGEALDSVGEQRPPGMIVVGWAVLSLWNKGDMTILEDNAELRDEPRVRVWLDGKPWRITEGLDDLWTDV